MGGSFLLSLLSCLGQFVYSCIITALALLIGVGIWLDKTPAVFLRLLYVFWALFISLRRICEFYQVLA